MSKNMRKVPGKTLGSGKDPVEVYCRLKPVRNGPKCITALDSKTVVLTLSDNLASNRGNASVCKEIQCTFKEIFDESCTQKDVFNRVAFPLIDGLFSGQNGLLFTYGVTGSGKTFTMNGVPENGGIIPRSLDVLFNSISSVQARKFLFKSDHMNGFDIQSEVEAVIDEERELAITQKVCKTPKKVISNFLVGRVRDTTKVDQIDERCIYAVFVSHVEIYNNHIYDLLDDTLDEAGRPRIAQSRILREDVNRNMFVHGVTEVEVTSTEEAFDVFYRGQKRKKMAQTNLNMESSRSHSVFTLRLVKALIKTARDEIPPDKLYFCVSQLSMVDLAGIERTNRTKNSGLRLREAGNINNSLLNLRTCFEVLRENQKSGTSKMVPYRTSRLTHLFKSYFEGEGQVKMIICINPELNDYDETVHVLKFADISKEVLVARSTVKKLDDVLNTRKKKPVKLLDRIINDSTNVTPAVPVPTSLGLTFPSLEITSSDNSDLIKKLVTFLEKRIESRTFLMKQLHTKQQECMNKLLEREEQYTTVQEELSSIKCILEVEKQKYCVAEKKIDTLQSLLQERNTEIEILRNELDKVNSAMIQRIPEKAKETLNKAQRSVKNGKEIHQQLTADHKVRLWMKNVELHKAKQRASNSSFSNQEMLTSSSPEIKQKSTDQARNKNPYLSYSAAVSPMRNICTTRGLYTERKNKIIKSRRRSRSASQADIYSKENQIDRYPSVSDIALRPAARYDDEMADLQAAGNFITSPDSDVLENIGMAICDVDLNVAIDDAREAFTEMESSSCFFSIKPMKKS